MSGKLPRLNQSGSASPDAKLERNSTSTLAWDVEPLRRQSESGSISSLEHEGLPPKSPRSYACQSCQDRESPSTPSGSLERAESTDSNHSFCPLSNLDSPTHQRIVVKLPCQPHKQSPSMRPKSTCIYDSRLHTHAAVKLPPPPVKPKPKISKRKLSGGAEDKPVVHGEADLKPRFVLPKAKVPPKTLPKPTVSQQRPFLTQPDKQPTEVPPPLPTRAPPTLSPSAMQFLTSYTEDDATAAKREKIPLLSDTDFDFSDVPISTTSAQLHTEPTTSVEEPQPVPVSTLIQHFEVDPSSHDTQFFPPMENFGSQSELPGTESRRHMAVTNLDDVIFSELLLPATDRSVPEAAETTTINHADVTSKGPPCRLLDESSEGVLKRPVAPEQTFVDRSVQPEQTVACEMPAIDDDYNSFARLEYKQQSEPLRTEKSLAPAPLAPSAPPPVSDSLPVRNVCPKGQGQIIATGPEANEETKPTLLECLYNDTSLLGLGVLNSTVEDNYARLVSEVVGDVQNHQECGEDLFVDVSSNTGETRTQSRPCNETATESSKNVTLSSEEPSFVPCLADNLYLDTSFSSAGFQLDSIVEERFAKLVAMHKDTSKMDIVLPSVVQTSHETLPHVLVDVPSLQSAPAVAAGNALSASTREADAVAASTREADAVAASTREADAVAASSLAADASDSDAGIMALPSELLVHPGSIKNTEIAHRNEDTDMTLTDASVDNATPECDLSASPERDHQTVHVSPQQVSCTDLTSSITTERRDDMDNTSLPPIADHLAPKPVVEAKPATAPKPTVEAAQASAPMLAVQPEAPAVSKPAVQATQPTVKAPPPADPKPPVQTTPKPVEQAEQAAPPKPAGQKAPFASTPAVQAAASAAQKPAMQTGQPTVEAPPSSVSKPAVLAEAPAVPKPSVQATPPAVGAPQPTVEASPPSAPKSAVQAALPPKLAEQVTPSDFPATPTAPKQFVQAASSTVQATPPTASNPAVQAVPPAAPKPAVQAVPPAAQKPAVQAVPPAAPKPTVQAVPPAAPKPAVQAVPPAAQKPAVQAAQKGDNRSVGQAMKDQKKGQQNGPVTGNGCCSSVPPA